MQPLNVSTTDLLVKIGVQAIQIDALEQQVSQLQGQLQGQFAALQSPTSADTVAPGSPERATEGESA